jgi:hypothetical protein
MQCSKMTLNFENHLKVSRRSNCWDTILVPLLGRILCLGVLHACFVGVTAPAWAQTAPYLDATGWTMFTPSPDTRTVYVSNSAGRDSNNGFSASTPVKTIAKGLSRLRSGYPDWLLLRKGDTWTGEVFDFVVQSGRSAGEPMLISSYGSGSRPLVKPNPKVNGTGIGSLGGRHRGGDFLAVVGIEFYNYTRDPTNPSFDPTNPDIQGTRFLNPVTWVLIEDCKFSFFQNNISFDLHLNPTPSSSVIIRRNVIVDAYSIATHAGGIYLDSVTSPLIEENVIDHNGWNASVTGADQTKFNHNIYIQSTSGPAIVRGNIIANASANGLQARRGGVIADNLFVHNPIAGFVAGTASSVTQNVILEGINNANIGNSWGFFVNSGASGSVVQNNIIAHSNVASPEFASDIESGNSGVMLTDNIIYSWGFTRQIVDNGSGNVTTPNEINAAGYPDPNRSVGSYNLTLGGAATLDAFLVQARLQSKENWNPQLMAKAVNNYIRAGFGVTSSLSGTTPPSTGRSPTVSLAHSGPTVVIDSPENNTVVKGNATANIVVSASDVSGIASISVTVDGTPVQTCINTTSCSATWHGKKMPQGWHEISAKAISKAGVTGSALVTILSEW